MSIFVCEQLVQIDLQVKVVLSLQSCLQVQSWSPQLILGPLRQAPANKHVAVLWAAILAVLPAVMGPTMLAADIFQNHNVGAMTAVLVVRYLLAL
jgi:hypothetical protein